MSTEQVRGEYAAAAQTLRETVKWLIAAFAAPLAIFVGTAPLATLAAIQGTKLEIAILLCVICVGAVLLAIKLASDLLIPGPIFVEEIGSDPTLVRYIDDHGADLLPLSAPTLEKFLRERKDTMQLLTTEGDAAPESAREDYATNATITARLIGLSGYMRLRDQFRLLRIRLLGLAGVSIVALAGFVALTNAPPEPKPSLPDIKVYCPVVPVARVRH